MKKEKKLKGVWDKGHQRFYSDEEIEKGLKGDLDFLRKILLGY